MYTVTVLYDKTAMHGVDSSIFKDVREVDSGICNTLRINTIEGNVYLLDTKNIFRVNIIRQEK